MMAVRRTDNPVYRRHERRFNILLLPTTPHLDDKIGDDMETEVLGKQVNTSLAFIRNCVPVSVVGYAAITVPARYSKEAPSEIRV
jgi:Asp-tRNA(Asn)/Glu-tRNA(Gln) amidotransferase A subunit family amidase